MTERVPSSVRGWPPRQIAGVTLLGIGALLCVAVAWWATSMVATAWSACYDLEAGHRFALVFFVLPICALLVVGGYLATAFALRRRPTMIRFVAALAVAAALCWVAIAMNVPLRGPEFWADVPEGDLLRTCSPGGYPASWPWFLRF
jgi:hypothetical protein